MYSYLIGKDINKTVNYIELGGGVNYSLLDIEDLNFGGELYESNNRLRFSGLIAYRYQSPMGFLLRLGFTPILTLPNGSIQPKVGVSLGYWW